MSIRISRILHAGYIFETAMARVAFDPIFENPFSVNCYAFPEIVFDEEKVKELKFDAVFISHFHDDHFSLESLDKLNKSTPIYMFCIFPELLDLIKALGFTQVRALNLNEAIDIKDLKITTRKALDEDVDCLYQIQAGGLNILNVVDSWIDEETLNLLCQQPQWDLILWPFQTMRELEVISPSIFSQQPAELPTEWMDQLKLLKPLAIVPSSCQFKMESWSWYNQSFFPISYQKFTDEIKNILPSTEVHRLDPGQSFVLNKKSNVTNLEIQPAKSLSFIKSFAVQSSDYNFDLNNQPQDMKFIAEQFPLSEKQVENVLRFCDQELVKIYNSHFAETDSYFHKGGWWHFVLYAPHAKVLHRYYEFSESGLNLESNFAAVKNEFEVIWKTEICIAKLYSALENGESLSSLYVRINEMALEAVKRKKLYEVDVLEDPLLRCLYNGKIGSYQKAQLHRIKKTN